MSSSGTLLLFVHEGMQVFSPASAMEQFFLQCTTKHAEAGGMEER